MNNRRKLVIALGASALATSLASFAQQQGKVWRIGFLWENAQSASVKYLEAFKAGMRELGYVEGRNYAIEQRSAENDLTRLPALAAELVALKVDLIVLQGTRSAVAAHKVTREIPIVMTIVGEPVGIGLAASLSHPGGNVTGLTSQASELKIKHLDLMRQMVPGLRRVGFLYEPDNVTSALGWKQFESTCSKLQIKATPAPLRKADEIAAAFKIMTRDKAQAFVVSAGSVNFNLRGNIVEQAALNRLPAIYPRSDYAEAGGLISYAADYVDLTRRAAAYGDKIFRGTKPGDLPIEQPLKFETVINMKTAKALGIKIPDVVMLRADKVIE